MAVFYSGDNGFIDGTGNSFTLADNTTYEANAIQIIQTDMAGNVADISKNIARIVVDNTDPPFDLQSTTVNVRVNTPITTTVYDAQVTNLSGTILIIVECRAVLVMVRAVKPMSMVI